MTTTEVSAVMSTGLSPRMQRMAVTMTSSGSLQSMVTQAHYCRVCLRSPYKQARCPSFTNYLRQKRIAECEKTYTFCLCDSTESSDDREKVCRVTMNARPNRHHLHRENPSKARNSGKRQWWIINRKFDSGEGPNVKLCRRLQSKRDLVLVRDTKSYNKTNLDNNR